MCIVVDNILYFGSNNAAEKIVEEEMKEDVQMKFDGVCKWFLGMTVTQNEEMTTLHQAHYVDEIIELAETLFDTTNLPIRQNHIPGYPSYRDADSSHFDSVSETNKKKFQMITGKLRYLTLTRPDIEYALNSVCRHNNDPKYPTHIMQLFHLIGYLKRHKHYAIKIGSENYGKVELNGFTDSSFGDDKKERKSTGGHILLLNDVPIIWTSKLSPYVCASTPEAEYIAAAELTRNIKYIRNVLDSIGICITKKAAMHMDSAGAKRITVNTTISSRTKHIEIQYHITREAFRKGEIDVFLIRSKDNPADMMTKFLGPTKLSTHRSKVLYAYDFSCS
jgi:hypothetical protein